MSEVKHTPGPWVAKPLRDCASVIAEVHDNDGESWGITCDWDDAYAAAEFDARLIAAAPDLLEALLAAEDKAQRGILAMSDAEIELVSALRRAAIAKATGQ